MDMGEWLAADRLMERTSSREKPSVSDHKSDCTPIFAIEILRNRCLRRVPGETASPAWSYKGYVLGP